jgi:NAD(P)-dependent dehydrogenase (short-subunit alcohol dehydrogenase family)
MMARGELLEGRVAIVTGGGGEIGTAICRTFAAEGAKVMVLDISQEKAAATADAIRAEGGKASALAVDVTDAASVQSAVARTIETYGKITTLANVAATVTPAGTVETLALEDWNKAWAVNVTGAFLMCKFAIPEMRKAGGGAIVNIASSHAHIGVPKRIAYCSTKGAVLQFTKVLAIDHAADGIRVNSISPGAIDTLRGALQRFPTREAANAAKGPSYLLNRTGQTQEIADGAVYLASDMSSFMTGTDLLIDGGYLAFKGSLTHPA